jgi:hypothetical protein
METGHQTENPTLSSNLFKSCHKKIRRYINIYLMGAILAIIYIYICIICTIIYCVIFWWRDHESWSPADRVAVSLKASQQAVGPAANTAQVQSFKCQCVFTSTCYHICHISSQWMSMVPCLFVVIYAYS